MAAASIRRELVSTATYTVPRSRTARIHRIEWQGWTDAADIEAAYSVAMDINFYHYGPWLKKPDGTWPHGYITGSGLPMKFVHADGTLTSVYQQLTEMADDHMLAETIQHRGDRRANWSSSPSDLEKPDRCQSCWLLLGVDGHPSRR